MAAGSSPGSRALNELLRREAFPHAILGDQPIADLRSEEICAWRGTLGEAQPRGSAHRVLLEFGQLEGAEDPSAQSQRVARATVMIVAFALSWRLRDVPLREATQAPVGASERELRTLTGSSASGG